MEHRELEPRFHELVGRIATEWAILEFHVNECIWLLADVYPALGACITSQIININGRLTALLALMKVRRVDQKLVDKINQFASDVRGPLEKRNRAIHDPMIVEQTEGLAGRITVVAPKKLTFTIQEITFEELQSDFDEIMQCSLTFQGYRQQIVDALPSLPGIPLKELHPITVTPRQK
jgi:hypothetical protein